MRERLCKVCRCWHEVDNWPRACYVIASEARSDSLQVPYFISDTMEPCVSMADGRTYSSKSSLRATYRPSGNAEGASYIEVGNAPVAEPKPLQSNTKSVKESLQIAKQRAGF